MKYKPCCNRKCLLARCEIRDNGGCYCVCSQHDYICTLEGVIKGTHLMSGCIYIPDALAREKYLQNLPLKKQSEEKRFREVDAPILLDIAKNRIKEYEIFE